MLIIRITSHFWKIRRGSIFRMSVLSRVGWYVWRHLLLEGVIHFFCHLISKRRVNRSSWSLWKAHRILAHPIVDILVLVVVYILKVSLLILNFLKRSLELYVITTQREFFIGSLESLVKIEVLMKYTIFLFCWE